MGRPRTATASPNGYATAIDPAFISRLCCEARANDDMAKTVISAGEEGEDQREDEVPAGAGARLQQGHRQGRHARRDHQLRAVPAEASRGTSTNDPAPPPWMQLCFLARCLFIQGLAVAAVLAVLVHEDRGIKPGGELQHRRGPLRPAAQPGDVQPCGSAGHGAADGAGRAFLPPDEPLAADANFCRILWLWAGDGRQ